MLTNPNTLGLFDENIQEISQVVHDAGGLLYYDGANANAILGISRPGDMGFDIVHFNLHKTFSTPHGGAGRERVRWPSTEELARFLPVPTVERRADGTFYLDRDRPEAVGRIRSFYGNFGVLVRAYAYIRAHGPEGLRRVSEYAVLHANYLMRRLAPYFDLPYDRHCKHEFVLSGRRQKEAGRAHGGHRQEAARLRHPRADGLLSPHRRRSDHDRADGDGALGDAGRLRRGDDPDRRGSRRGPGACQDRAPRHPVGRLDETRAARRPVLRWRPSGCRCAIDFRSDGSR